MATPNTTAKPVAVSKTSSAAGPVIKSAPKVTPQRAPSFKIEDVHTKARWINFLVYGNYGCGKTFLTSTAVSVPEMRDVLLIDAEAGDMTLMGESKIHNFEDINTIRVKDFKQVARVQEFLRIHCKLRDEGDTGGLRDLEARLKGVEPDEIDEPRKYYTVIIDSLAEVEAYCLNQLLGVSELTRLDEEAIAAEWSEYKKNRTMILRLVRGFRDLPMHVLITCPAQYQQDETKRMLWSLSLTGKLSSQVQGAMDVVGFLTTLQPETENAPIPRRLYVQPIKGNKFDAKCRFSSFKGSHFDNPTMGTILETVGLTSAITPKTKSKPTLKEDKK